jgi:uncharacterized MAPEG superfamily protein
MHVCTTAELCDVVNRAWRICYDSTRSIFHSLDIHESSRAILFDSEERSILFFLLPKILEQRCSLHIELPYTSFVERSAMSSHSASTVSSTAKAVDRMNEYKGPGHANPAIIFSGVLFGFLFPHVLVRLAPAHWTEEVAKLDRSESVLLVLESLILVSILFYLEFQVGVIARSTSLKASFSPAAAQANGSSPFVVIQANRIHQNQIESACMYLPAALAATAAGVNVSFVIASVFTWTIARVFYRCGYVQESPMWRAFGLFGSYVQWFVCLCLYFYRKVMV